ncbi:MAG: hypothetical protein A4E25_00047 [Methanobacterium sp. PtaB.Bin024]|nr:MAG: hypothetical protein A4E25_00047 [Methanobacterium sp. PtaB.Bin024]
MKRINYKKLAYDADSKKYGKLYEQKPFLTLSQRERHWWIRYYKLEVAAQKAGWNEKFPKLPDGAIRDKPWFRHDHWINLELNVIQRFVEKKLVDWEKLQDYKVDMVFCDDDCEGCKSYLLCELRRE